MTRAFPASFLAALLWAFLAAGFAPARSRAEAISPTAAPDFGADQDTGGSARGRALPWIAHSAAEAFYLASPAAADGGPAYQISTYQGFTIQSLAFATFHAGWRYRETLVPGLSAPYRDIFALKLMGTAELLRDRLFVSLGGSIPLADSRVAEADSAVLQRTLSGYSPLPSPNFATPQELQAGVYGRSRFGAWDLMAGVAYSRATRFEPVAGHPFHPASRLGGSLRAVLETGRSRHRFDAKASRFGEEETAAEAPAHREGALYQARYAWLRTAGRTSWQLGLGAAAKGSDANRRLRLRAPLEPAEANDNVQRAYAEAVWTRASGTALLWRAWVLPKALLEGPARGFGHETEAGVSLGMRVWGAHRLRLGASALAGSFQGIDYLGAGMRAEFAFRQLGFQDLAAPTEPGGEGQ